MFLAGQLEFILTIKTFKVWLEILTVCIKNVECEISMTAL